MTVAHRVLYKYVKENFAQGYFSIQYIDPDKVRIQDRKGESITLTLNLYCDILDAETNEIYAVSDLPHDLTHVGLKTPGSWKELERTKEEKYEKYKSDRQGRTGLNSP